MFYFFIIEIIVQYILVLYEPCCSAASMYCGGGVCELLIGG